MKKSASIHTPIPCRKRNYATNGVEKYLIDETIRGETRVRRRSKSIVDPNKKERGRIKVDRK